MDAKCPGIIEICALRVTQLDDDGSPAAGADNFYVSNKTVTLAVNSDVEQGQRRTVRSGCGCIVATKRSRDILQGYTFEFTGGVWEPALEAMLLGGDPLLSTDGTATIGLNVSGDQIGCDFVPRKVALEAWANAWDVNGPDGDLAYIHYIWPSTQWQKGSETLSEDFAQQALTGFSERNLNWGTGPHADGPTDGTSHASVDWFAKFMTGTIPEASCDYQTVA